MITQNPDVEIEIVSCATRKRSLEAIGYQLGGLDVTYGSQATIQEAMTHLLPSAIANPIDDYLRKVTRPRCLVLEDAFDCQPDAARYVSHKILFLHLAITARAAQAAGHSDLGFGYIETKPNEKPTDGGKFKFSIRTCLRSPGLQTNQDPDSIKAGSMMIIDNDQWLLPPNRGTWLLQSLFDDVPMRLRRP